MSKTPVLETPSKPGDTEEHPTRSGYYREYDRWRYLTSSDALYAVDDSEATEPVWRNFGLLLLDDAESRTPDAEGLALFERTRVAYGIPE